MKRKWIGRSSLAGATVALLALLAVSAQSPRPIPGPSELKAGELVLFVNGGSHVVGKVQSVEGRWVQVIDEHPRWVNLDEVFSLTVLSERRYNEEKRKAADPRELAMRDMEALRDAMKQYAINNAGRYPSDLEALILQDEAGLAYIEGGETALLDPWGTRYFLFTGSNGALLLGSYAADGQRGGIGADKDLIVAVSDSPSSAR